MTIRTLVLEVLDCDDDPMAALIGGIDLARGMYQGGREPVTLAGTVASLNAWLEIYKEINGQTIRKWIDDLEKFAEIEIPDEQVIMLLSGEG